MEVPMEVLSTPLKFRVEREYLGPDSKHIVAQSGDYVVVCAWIQNRTTALAYSERNSTIGKIPVSCLDLENSRPAVIDGVYLASESQHVSRESFWDIGWVAGSHIKVYQFRESDSSIKKGIGLNLATGKVGVFRYAFQTKLKRV